MLDLFNPDKSPHSFPQTAVSIIRFFFPISSRAFVGLYFLDVSHSDSGGKEGWGKFLHYPGG